MFCSVSAARSLQLFSKKGKREVRLNKIKNKEGADDNSERGLYKLLRVDENLIRNSLSDYADIPQKILRFPFEFSDTCSYTITF